MPTYFITSPQIQGEHIHVIGPLLKHLKDALRIKQGESLIFVDEERQRYLAQVDRISPQLIVARIMERREPAPPPALSITMGQGIIKGKKMDWVVQKATEIGVDQIIPLLTGRTVVRLEGLKARRQQERWQAIAHEAAQQSGRDQVPSVRPVCSLPDFIRSTDHQLRLILWEGETERSLKDELSTQKDSKSVSMLIGPEGGFSQEEVEDAKDQGFRAVHLGEKILRAETAGLVTLGILQYLWGDLGT
jgi:16S rRNA (uracil1498-N3)-methyltransferase